MGLVLVYMGHRPSYLDQTFESVQLSGEYDFMIVNIIIINTTAATDHASVS